VTTYTWALSAGTVGPWASAGDWSPSGVPQTGDSAILADGGTILLGVGSATGSTVYLADGELIFAGGTSSIGSTTAIISTGDASTITALGTFINAGTIEAGAGDALTISIGASAELQNAGEIIADGGTVTTDASIGAIDGGYGTTAGLTEIANGGVSIIAFDNATAGNTLELANANQPSLQIFGFQQGDTIDFGTSLSAGTLYYSDGAFGTSPGVFDLETSPGVILAAVDFVSGAMPGGIFPITFTDGTAVAGGFTLTTSGGDTLLTTSAVNDMADTGGVWQDADLWSNGVPGIADTPIIGQDALSAFTLSTGGPATPVTVAGLSVVGPDATLNITNAVSVTSLPAINMGGSIEVADGGTLSAPTVEMP
jgi:hypothetical protein